MRNTFPSQAWAGAASLLLMPAFNAAPYEVLAVDRHCCVRNAARLDNIERATFDQCIRSCSALTACQFVSFTGHTGSGRGQCVLCAACELVRPAGRLRFSSYGRTHREGVWGTTNETTCVSPRSPPQLEDLAPKVSHADAPTVAISLPVYESEPWIDMLLSNFLTFAAPTTSIVLHLNANTQYAPCLIQQWNRSAGRIAVNRQRIGVAWGTGSILWAHVLNAKEIAIRWPSCGFVVLQASNMVWVRPGFEMAVATTKCASFDVGAPSGQRTARRMGRNGVYRAVATRGRHAWMYHEGSFYPLQVNSAIQWLSCSHNGPTRGPLMSPPGSSISHCDRLLFCRDVSSVR